MGSSSPTPKALIAPHAGYAYSGPIAGSAFRHWRGAAHIRNVVILGPSHYTIFPGLALSGATHWATPLGLVPVNLELTEKIAALKSVRFYELAHTQEHALEVELAFLQRLLKDFTIVPLVVCDATPDEISEVVECLWGGEETAFVISSDLSHYLDYLSARKRDRATADAIEALDADRIQPHDACGRLPIQGWLQVAAQRRFQCKTADLRNSGDTAGDKKRVVGYGAFSFNQAAPANA